MMNGQYGQLVQSLDVILQKVVDVHKLRFIYNFAKKSGSRAEQDDLGLLESIAKPFIDPYIDSRQLFTQWIIYSDIYVTNSNYTKDAFLKRFIKQRDKVQTEFDKSRPDSKKLMMKVGELRIHLDALEQNGKRAVKTANMPEKSTPQLDNTIILEKGKTVDILRQVSDILNASTGFLKVMDKWVSDRTLDYFASAPEIPIRILTSNIDTKRLVPFQVMLNRINETRQNKIEVRACSPSEFHDRYIITEKDLWIIGSSLKDVGYKNWTTINRSGDGKKRKELSEIFDKLWSGSTVVTFL